jgi:hypothetical protein
MTGKKRAQDKFAGKPLDVVGLGYPLDAAGLGVSFPGPGIQDRNAQWKDQDPISQQSPKVKDVITLVNKKLRSKAKTWKGYPPPDGIKIGEFRIEGFEGIGELYCRKQHETGHILLFKFIVPFHHLKANYHLRVYLFSGKIKQDHHVRDLRRNFPGLVPRIQKVIEKFLKSVEEDNSV